MFKFLRERRQRKVLTLCEAELARIKKAYAVYATPHDLATQAALLERATSEDLTEDPIIKRLEFLHRLLVYCPVNFPCGPSAISEAFREG
jgi:hypothetical protein